MLRLTELKLPLDHAPEALPALIAQTLGVPVAALEQVQVHKRSHDARKQQLLLVSIAHVTLAASIEQHFLERFALHSHIGPAP